MAPDLRPTTLAHQGFPPLLALMPDGARLLEPLTMTSATERAELTYCMNTDSVAMASLAVQHRLERAGWRDIQTQEAPTRQHRLAIWAQKKPYVLTALIERGPMPSCSGEANQTHVSLGIHRPRGVTVGASGLFNPKLPTRPN